MWHCGFAKARQTSPGFTKVRMKARACFWYTLQPAWSEGVGAHSQPMWSPARLLKPRCACCCVCCCAGSGGTRFGPTTCQGTSHRGTFKASTTLQPQKRLPKQLSENVSLRLWKDIANPKSWQKKDFSRNYALKRDFCCRICPSIFSMSNVSR